MRRDTEYHERLRKQRRRIEQDTEPDDDYDGVEIPEDYEPKPKPIVLSAAKERNEPDPWSGGYPVT